MGRNALSVVDFTGVTSLEGDPDRVLERASGRLKSAIVIGFTKEGDEYFSSSLPDGGDVIWLLERMKLKILRVADQ